jgi:hypothetical protein
MATRQKHGIGHNLLTMTMYATASTVGMHPTDYPPQPHINLRRRLCTSRLRRHEMSARVLEASRTPLTNNRPRTNLFKRTTPAPSASGCHRVRGRSSPETKSLSHLHRRTPRRTARTRLFRQALPPRTRAEAAATVLTTQARRRTLGAPRCNESVFLMLSLSP